MQNNQLEQRDNSLLDKLGYCRKKYKSIFLYFKLIIWFLIGFFSFLLGSSLIERFIDFVKLIEDFYEFLSIKPSLVWNLLFVYSFCCILYFLLLIIIRSDENKCIKWIVYFSVVILMLYLVYFSGIVSQNKGFDEYNSWLSSWTGNFLMVAFLLSYAIGHIIILYKISRIAKPILSKMANKPKNVQGQ